MSTDNLPPADIYNFITGDFESAWNSVALNSSAANRGNFMFGLQTMILLELLSRLCLSDEPNAINDFSTALSAIEPRYFTKLHFTVRTPADFSLPTQGAKGQELLHIIFRLVRNGQAHQYQQTRAEFTNGGALIVTLGGAEPGATLDKIRAVHSAHLAFHTESQNMSIIVSPGITFLDLKQAAEDARLLKRGLTFNYSTQKVAATIPTIEASLLAAKHTKIP